MKFQSYIEKNMDDLVSDLQGCIRIPSVYTEDDSGYPYGKPVQDCLEYVLNCAAKLGFSTVNYFSKVFKDKVGMTPTEYSRYSSKRRLLAEMEEKR